MPKCSNCRKDFTTFGALQQHCRDSPGHTQLFRLKHSDHPFATEKPSSGRLALSQKSNKGYKCNGCDRNLGSGQALRKHLASARHFNDTPVDKFFWSFPDFDYSPSSSPSAEFRRLQAFYGWKPKDHESDDAWERYRDALVQEFNTWYGTDDSSLGLWQNLCNVLRIQPLPQSCKACREAVRGCHVNMVDLISHGRGNLDALQIFPDLESLRVYTIKTGRFFPKDSLEAGALLRHLLREILVS